MRSTSFGCFSKRRAYSTSTLQHSNTPTHYGAPRVLNHIGYRTHREHIECVAPHSDVSLNVGRTQLQHFNTPTLQHSYKSTSAYSGVLSKTDFAKGHSGIILIFLSLANSTAWCTSCLPAPLPFNDASTSV